MSWDLPPIDYAGWDAFQSDRFKTTTDERIATLAPPEPSPPNRAAELGYTPPTGPAATPEPLPPEPAPSAPSLADLSQPAPFVPDVQEAFLPAAAQYGAAMNQERIPGTQGGDRNSKLALIGDVARGRLDDEAARVLQSVAVTEGGLEGAVGDLGGGGSFGPFQFYAKGQLPNFARWLGVSLDEAKTRANDLALATTFAADTYLGAALQRGRALGLSGADLATYVQRTGQVSVNPEKTGQNYLALFGGGGDPFSGSPRPTVPSAVPAAAARNPVQDFAEWAGSKIATLGQPAEEVPRPVDARESAFTPAQQSTLDTLRQQGEQRAAPDLVGDVGAAFDALGTAAAGAASAAGQTVGNAASAAGEAALGFARSAGQAVQSVVQGAGESAGNALLTNATVTRAGLDAANEIRKEIAPSILDPGFPFSPENQARSNAILLKEQQGQPLTDEDRAFRESQVLALAGMVGGPAAAGGRLSTAATAAQKAVIGAQRVELPPGTIGADIARAGDVALRSLYNQFGEMATNAPGPLPSRFESMRRFLVRKATDQGVDLAEFQAEARKAAGRALTPDEMASEMSRLNPSGAAERRIQNVLKPAIQSVGEDVQPLRAYLTLQDNLDVAAAMGNQNRAFSGGLTAATSRDALAVLRQDLGPERIAKVEQSAEQVWAYGRQLLDRKREAGLISQSLYDDLTAKYPHYAPTRIVDYLKEPRTIPVGKKLSVRDAGLKRNTTQGTTRQREDPLASFVRLAYETEGLAAKNEAARAFLKLRAIHPDGRSMIRQLKTEAAAPRGFENMSVFVDGERQIYQMPDYIAQAITREKTAAIPLMTPMMNVFRALATQRNPAFLMSNSLNDMVSYTLRASAREGGPQAVPKVLAELFRAYGDTFQGLLRGEYRGNTARYLGGGGSMSGFFSSSPTDMKKVADGLQRTSALQVRNVGDLKEIVRQAMTLEPVEAIGNRIELAPRVAAMRRAEQQGASVRQAVLAGRSVTIDFSQGGTWAKGLNQVVPFFNVAMQSAVTPARAFRQNPAGSFKTAVGLLAAPTVAIEAWNRMDAQRSRDYDDVPEYIRDAGLVVMLPGGVNRDEQGDRKPQYLFLPTREFSPFVTLTREAAGRALGQDAREWASLLGGTAGSVSPVRGNNPSDLASTFVPLGVSTAMQLASGDDWFRGRKIVSRYSEQQASEVSKALASAVNRLFGMNVSPGAVEFGIRDLGAGVGGAALALGDAAIKASRGQPLRKDGRLQSLPVAGGVVGRFLKDTGGATLDRLQARTLTPSAQQVLKEAGVDMAVSPVRGEVSVTVRGKARTAPLTRSEQATYQEWTNRYVDEAIQQLVREPAWERASAGDREVEVRRRVARAREQAQNRLLDQLGQQEFERRVAASVPAAP